MSVGERLQSVRKRRGLTQRGLARESGVSLSLVRKLEQGEREDTRLETARKLAVALRVKTSDLISDPSEDGPDSDTSDHWAPVRKALHAPEPVDVIEEPPTLAGVRTALGDALPLFSGDQFARLAVMLPALLRDADALARSDQDGRHLRVRLLQLTGWLFTQTRQFEDAQAALERSLEDSTDRLQAAATVNTMCWLYLRRGQLDDARQLATRWADDVEPRVSRATPAELSTWGWLLLRVSAAAIRDNREPEARDALRFANSAAVALGREFAPENDFLRTFGPVTVALKRTENEMIVDHPDSVLRLASRIPPSALRPTSNNRNRHLLDVADAHARTRDFSSAMEVLTGIYATSPEWLPNQRYAKDIMGRIVQRRRSLTPEMRTLANAVRLPL